MQKTTNYKLPKWEKADRILMDDFNGLTGTLDTVLHGVAVSAEAAQAAVDSEAADRQAADAAEATARANAVTAEATARENADAALRTAVDGKQAKLTGAATTIAASNLTASRALVSDANGKVAVSAVTAAELGCLDGVTSAVQTQLNGKAASSHTHAQSDVAGLAAALAAKGNCSVQLGSYVGSGLYGEKNPNVLRFSVSPKAVLLMGPYAFLLFVRGCPYAYGHSYDSYLAPSVTWTDTSVSWYAANAAEQQLNSASLTYYYTVWG